jgi:hypothetical protein
LNGPYKLQVVLRFADHRAFTNVFKDQVERGLRDNLRAAFRDMAMVEVVRTHPRLKEIEEKGLQVLDSWKDVSEVKTHFVLIDYVDNSYYEIRARQYDGLTAEASPVIRRERTNERPFLARTIGFLIDHDFGPVGSVANLNDEANVQVALKGAGLNVPLSRWVKPGDVFQLVRIVHSGGREMAEPEPFALLQAKDAPNKNGAVSCRFFHRYKLSARGGAAGYRCIKIATMTGPLRVRLLQQGARTPRGLNAYTVYVQRQGFEKEPDAPSLATNTEGLTGLFGAGREKPFENLAFVVIFDPKKSNKPVAQIPVPILDDRTVSLALNADQEAATPLELRLGFWVRRINDRITEDEGIFAELSKLAKESDQPAKRAAVLQKARLAKVGLDEDVYNIQKERKELEDQAKETPNVRLNFAEGDERLKFLERDRTELAKFIDGQEQVVSKDNDPEVREFLSKLEQAKAQEQQFEYGEAIKLYEEAQQGLKKEDLAKQIQKLKDDWQVKSDEHQKARQFIYQDWPEFDQARMKEKIKKAKEAFETFKKVGDRLSPRKLLRVAINHDKKLKDILAGLHPDVDEEDKEPAKDALDATTELAALIKEVTRFIEESGEKK